MKYELTQGQYADFLNHLTPSQAAACFPTPDDISGAGTMCPDKYRYTISNNGGTYTAAAPGYGNNWMMWEDDIAYADWAGLRPLTEREYEKTGRGPLPALASEYAWGTTTIVPVTGFNGTDGSGVASWPRVPANATGAFSAT